MRGFTLIELIVVISAIAILAGIIVPTVGSLVDDAKVNRMQAECKTLIAVCLKYEKEVGFIPFANVAGTTSYAPQLNSAANMTLLMNRQDIVGATTYIVHNYCDRRIGMDPWSVGYGYYEAVGVVAAANYSGVVGSYGPDRANGPTTNEWATATWNVKTALPTTNRGFYSVFKTAK